VLCGSHNQPKCYDVNNQNRDYVIHTIAPSLDQLNIPVIDLFHQIIDLYPNPDDFLTAYGIGDFGHLADFSLFWDQLLEPQLLAAIGYSKLSGNVVLYGSVTSR